MKNLRRKSRWAFPVLLSVVLPLASFLFAAQTAPAQTSVTSAESEWRQDLEAWRARRAKEAKVEEPDSE